MRVTVISGSLFTEMVKGGAGYLGIKKGVVNDLNVFPIPDGDTGDNMFMTIDSGVSSATAEDLQRLDEVSQKIAQGMLLGARGNSGVILSRIFSGISKGFSGVEKADVRALAHALDEGVKEAYGAVAEPVEGTILTVFREAVEYANGRIGKRSTLQNYFEDFTRELRASLERTPELLAVLKDAGVVDSGGAGLVYIAEGMKSALRGESVENAILGQGHADGKKKKIDTTLFNENSVLKYGYCTEFLLQLQNSKVDVKNFDLAPFVSWLNANGESVVCFAEGSVIKVHVHTMHPGQILEHCQEYGEFLTLKIENMTLQHSESKIENRFDLPLPKKRKKYGIVSVAMGKGLKETFLSLGVDYVVDGGQSMNPSAADFIRAFDEVGADTIFVFPNNGNVILTARQAAELYDKSAVLVVNTKNIGQGYAGVSMLDTSSDDPDAILEELEEIIGEVVTGGVSTAVRDTENNGVKVAAGDFIGFVGEKVYSDAKTPEDALRGMVAELDAGSHDVMLLICGAEADGEKARAVYDELQKSYKRTEIIMIDGGQPIYHYIVVLE